MITKNTSERLLPAMKKALKSKQAFIDMHCHLFNNKTLPDGFIGFRVPYIKRIIKKVSHFILKLRKIIDVGEIDNYAYLVKLSEKKTEDIYKTMLKYYTDETIFTPLMIDLEN